MERILRGHRGRTRIRVAAFAALAVLAVAARPAMAADATLRLRVTGVGSSVQATPTGTLSGCTEDLWCTYRYPAGTRVALTATPTAAGSSLARWTGACGGSAPTCTVALSGDVSVTARFSPVRLYADEVDGHGDVTVSPEGQRCGFRCWLYAYGTSVSIFADAHAGYAFSGWYGLCSSVQASGCRFDILANVEAAPIFRCTTSVCSASYPLTQQVTVTANVQGRGAVSVNGKQCRGRCSWQVRRGVAVVVRAVPDTPGPTFRGWAGACLGAAPRCQFPAFKDAGNNAPVVTATFQ